MISGINKEVKESNKENVKDLGIIIKGKLEFGDHIKNCTSESSNEWYGRELSLCKIES